MIKFHNYEIDRSKYKVLNPAQLKQGDKKSNLLVVTLADKGIPLDLTGKTATVAFLTADEKPMAQTSYDLEDPVIITNNKVECLIMSGVLLTAGKAYAEVRIMDEGVRVFTSQRIQLNVKTQIDIDDAVENEDKFPVLETLINQVDSILVDLSRIEADYVSENTRIQNEAVRKTNEIARENLRDNLVILKQNLITDLENFESLSEGKITSFVNESNLKIQELVDEKNRVEAVYPVRLTALETTKVNNKNYSVKFEVVDNQPRLKMEEK